MGTGRRWGTKNAGKRHPDDFETHPCWIDDEGRALPHAFIGNSLTDRRRAFRRLGMVELRLGVDGALLRWDIANVSPMSIVRAAEALVDRPGIVEIVFEYFWGGWCRERVFGVNEAVLRLRALARYRRVEPLCSTVLQRQPSTGVRGEGDLIRAAFENWDRRNGRPDPVSDLGWALTWRYALSYRFDRAETGLIFDHIGDSAGAVAVFGRAWANTALGRACDRSQPDYEFEDRVCDAYRAVLETGEPQVDHVRAVIRRDGADPIWVPYRRLVLPIRDRFGAPGVVSLCDVTDDVAIPFMAA